MSSPRTLDFPSPGLKKAVTATFSGGQLSSDAGLLLLADVDRHAGLLAGFAACFHDRRTPARTRHSLLALLRQRVFQIALGYEDANDADTLRHDPALKLALGRLPESGPPLASQPTLSRLENAATRKDLLQLAAFLVDHFVARHRDVPVCRLVLDLDAVDDPTHGQQELHYYHGFYRTHCFLPLLVHATVWTRTAAGTLVAHSEQELLVAVLRPSRRGAAFRARSVLHRLLPRLRQAWPAAEVILRGDSAFATPELYAFAEAQGVGYCFGLAKNRALLRHAVPWLNEAQAAAQAAASAGAAEGAAQGATGATGATGAAGAAGTAGTAGVVRCLGQFRYRANSWDQDRQVMVKAEVLPRGPNPRFYVSAGLPDDLQELEARWRFYNARGDQENRIKEWKRDLRGDKTSCTRFAANQFRLLLHSVAHVLLQLLRRRLAGTAWARAQVSTLQLRLLKVAARIRETVRRVWLELPSSFPEQDTWRHILQR